MPQIDLRRPDERVSVNSEPFWFTSGPIGINAAGKDAVLKTFLALDGGFQILAAGVEVTEAFNGVASVVVGFGTMPTNALGIVTPIDVDQLLISTDVTEGALGYYPAAASAFFLAQGTGAATVILGLDAAVPTLYATLTGTPTVGKMRVHLLLARIPLANRPVQ